MVIIIPLTDITNIKFLIITKTIICLIEDNIMDIINFIVVDSFKLKNLANKDINSLQILNFKEPMVILSS